MGPTVQLTGERPIEGKTPDSLLALHEAGYREVLARLGPGPLLDLGCGLGDGSARFVAADRAVVGLDYDPLTAAAAVTRHPALRAVCSDGARLAVRSGSFRWACSSHLIEHFTDPEDHVAEVSRALAPGGVAFFITPNAPADFENPYHVHLFTPDSLREMLGRHFARVEVLGLDATEAVKEDFATRRAMADRLLRLDPLGLRHRLPRGAFVWLHATGRRLAYRYANTDQTGGASGITADDFFVTGDIDDTTLVLVAVCRDPLR
jgi:SAM-dependent methyltransferase